MPQKHQIYYSIGDIHGRYDLLQKIIELIKIDISKQNPNILSKLIFLGDYIDRGANSKQVIDYLIESDNQFDCVFLKGNHEQILSLFLQDPNKLDVWLINGGVETLASYGITCKITKDKDKDKDKEQEKLNIQQQLIKALGPEHISFLENLKNKYETDKYFFVHAGVRAGVELSQQQEKDLIWIREPFLSETNNF